MGVRIGREPSGGDLPDGRRAGMWGEQGSPTTRTRLDDGNRQGGRRRPRTPRRSRPRDHEPVTVLWTELNVPLMPVPRLWRMAIQTTTIRASITAYSTAVGPSSLATNRMRLASFRNMGDIPLRKGWRRIGRRTRTRDRTSPQDGDGPTRDRRGRGHRMGCHPPAGARASARSSNPMAHRPTARDGRRRRRPHATDHCSRDDHEPPSELWTELNVPLRLVPRLRITVTQTTTIRASITAYSTAVGPSSLTRKRRTFEKTPFISNSFPAKRKSGGRDCR